MYGYAPFAAPAGYQHGAMQHYPAYTLVGADAPAEKTLGSTVSDFLDKPTLESYPTVKNKHVIAVAAVLGLGYWGYREGWFR